MMLHCKAPGRAGLGTPSQPRFPRRSTDSTDGHRIASALPCHTKELTPAVSLFPSLLPHHHRRALISGQTPLVLRASSTTVVVLHKHRARPHEEVGHEFQRLRRQQCPLFPPIISVLSLVSSRLVTLIQYRPSVVHAAQPEPTL